MPLISKPNYNQIFASQAPEQDKPAVFNNYPLGWGVESRPNNGKPTIKGFNYLQQTSDLKDLWILQNGACLPYDESIEYVEGAPVLKDGVIQYKTAGGFTRIATPKSFYETLAEANADISNISVNQAVNVGESENGGLWYKDTAGATTLTKSPFDPVEQAKSYTDTAKSSAISTAAADATTKANAAEVNAKSYTDNVTEPKLLSGLDIYYQSKDDPTRLFQAIWQEYNKPVYHLGNSVVVDTTGAVLKTIEEELVFTIKLTAANETFIYPTRANTIAGQNAVIDWGDGIVTEHGNYLMNHTYVGNIGDEFTIKVKGNPLMFDFSAGNGGRRTSRLMLKSIDKNTMPKTMPYFNLSGCTNLAYLCRGAYNSWINTSAFSPNYVENSPNVVFHPKAFEGLGSVTDISNMFARTGQVSNFDIPTGLLDPFVNVTSAVNLFRGISKPLPTGVLDKLINLEDVTSMFQLATITTIDNRIFKNQTKLKNVSNCFRQATTLAADAFQLYTDMNQGNPTVVSGCFVNVNSMTNLAQVPTAWKTL